MFIRDKVDSFASKMGVPSEDLKKYQRSLLFFNQGDFFGDYLSDGNFVKHLSCDATQKIFEQFQNNDESQSVEECLKKCVLSWLNDKNSTERQFQLLSVGVAALVAFVQDNWCGPYLSASIPWLQSYMQTLEKDLDTIIIENLVLDGEAVVTVARHPELLILARAVLLSELPDIESAVWWRFRCISIHQQILEEKSPQLHDELVALKEQILQSKFIEQDQNLSILAQLEISQMHLSYHEVQPSHQLIQAALEAANLSLNLTGALGKRTRFQQRELAQLTLDVHASNQAGIITPCSQKDLPKDLKLDDDVRLDKIKFSNAIDGQYNDLSPIQQACVLAAFVQTQKCQPKDKLADEELLAYLSCLLSQPQVWSFQLSGLFFRSKIESNHSRTVERSMTQTQILVDSVSNPSPEPLQRLSMIFCSYMGPSWILEEQLADFFVSLGCINSALDIYLRLHCWEQVIACYNHLKLRHKAEEIIRQELDKKETVKLWCLLGDATDNVDYYEKAWNLSKKKSARAQKHWGLYYFHRKQYAEAIPHMQESLTHNSLQTTLWFQLGYASLQHENWSIAAKAYRRCCVLDPENFEAWNNLSKAYVNLGQKNRAWKSLQEALKWDYENWRVWENFLIVSLDCAVMDEVIRSYHRILDLKEKHIDVEVLEILGKAIIENLPDCDGVPCSALLGKSLALLGRITAQVTNNWKVWRLYSRLTRALPNPTPETDFKAVQHLQKAHRSAVVDASWVNDTEVCLEVIGLSEELANVSLTYANKIENKQQCLSVLSSAKLSVKSTLTKIKQQRLDLLTGQVEGVLLPHYNNLEDLLQKIVEASAG